MPDSQIPLQSETLAPVAGGGVRTVTATIPINGVPTQVQMQVVAVANQDGILHDQQFVDPTQREILRVLKDIRRLLQMHTGSFAPDEDTGPFRSSIGF